MSTSSSPPNGPAAGAQIAETEFSIELPEHGTVAARAYGQRRPGTVSPLVLHFHGGTFVCGTLDNGRYIGRLLAEAGAVVVSLAYPLAPEHPSPAHRGGLRRAAVAVQAPREDGGQGRAAVPRG